MGIRFEKRMRKVRKESDAADAGDSDSSDRYTAVSFWSLSHSPFPMAQIAHRNSSNRNTRMISELVTRSTFDFFRRTLLDDFMIFVSDPVYTTSP